MLGLHVACYICFVQPCNFAASVLILEACAAGAVLPIWKVLAETALPPEDKTAKVGDVDAPKGKDYARVVRLKLDSGEGIIGLSLMPDDVYKVSKLPRNAATDKLMYEDGDACLLCIALYCIASMQSYV